MPKIAVVSATDPGQLLFDPVVVPFLPEPGKPITVRQHETDQRKARDFMLTDLLRYEIITGDPEKSGAVYSGYPIG